MNTPEREELAATIGKIIKSKREEKKLSRYAVSKELLGDGKFSFKIKNYEEGKNIPDMFTFDKLLSILDVNFQEILTKI